MPSVVFPHRRPHATTLFRAACRAIQRWSGRSLGIAALIWFPSILLPFTRFDLRTYFLSSLKTSCLSIDHLINKQIIGVKNGRPKPPDSAILYGKMGGIGVEISLLYFPNNSLLIT